ncbi:DUF445 domain-containing protein [Cohnella nanjingensis]|uniref:DUF445 domain-containing protein n=1 Tax=Cohnella nanjingensis TaxID=1387779 RepID=A0A7X0RW21_9BACL|nr:DUF445 domain-containing protein [Cohnella nanjingensis]MBB6673516.1 DUF445 domain-containing protein [Cohnella nanjingensis]
MPGQAKHTAAISLGVMGAGFLATFPLGGWPGALLHGGFEAGLVGGLADWFAVTALFRHPLGIPIPHTALLPRNRDKVVRSLVSAMENELLTKESIIRKTSDLRIGDRLLAMVESHLPEATNVVVRVSEYLVRHVPVERVVPFVAQELGGRIRAIDTAAALRKIAEEALARGYEEQALGFLLAKADGFVSRPQIRQQLGTMAASALGNMQAGGFMGFAVNAFVGFMSEEKLGTLLQGAILSTLREMREDEAHPLRQLVLDEMRAAIAGLPEQPAVLAELERWKASLTDGDMLERYLYGWVEELKGKAAAFVQDPAYAERFVQPALTSLLSRLREDPAIVDGIQTWLQTKITQIVEDNHWKIGKLVKENIDKLDNASLIRMMEEKVGGDLQWIRVNGAVCGFLIGLILEGINLLM